MYRRIMGNLHLPNDAVKVALLIALMGLALSISVVVQDARAATVQDGRPNIIFVMVDALRSDHVSAYGYGHQTTPVLDSRLASKGVLFAEATAVSPWTNPSNGALLTSRMPSDIDTVWADMDGRIPESETLLAEYLQDAGYITAGFNTSWWMRAQYGYDQGFEVYQATEDTADYDRSRAAAVNDLATVWLNDNQGRLENGGNPLFLFLYYYDPHSWYDPLPPFDTLYDPDYNGFLTPEIYGHGKDIVSGAINLSQRDIEHLLALYDGEISYWDQQFGSMLDELQNRGLLQNSLIILSSDHGQMFGEHGKWLHRNSLYEEVLRVPLIMRYSGELPPGEVVDTPVDHLDVLPTILELAGIERPDHLRGDSLVPLINGVQTGHKRPLYAEMAAETDPEGDAYWIAPHTNLYAIRENGQKMIHAQQAPQADQLYNIEKNSIYERQNIIEADPDAAQALWPKLQRRFDIPTEFLFLPVIE